MKNLSILVAVFGIVFVGCTSVEGGLSLRSIQALEYAESVVLVRRVVQDNQVHSYVKEVWRFKPNGARTPLVGDEYLEPVPCDRRLRHAERDAIVFKFGSDKPVGFPSRWIVPITEREQVPALSNEEHGGWGTRDVTDAEITMYEPTAISLEEVRKAVMATKGRTSR